MLTRDLPAPVAGASDNKAHRGASRTTFRRLVVVGRMCVFVFLYVTWPLLRLFVRLNFVFLVYGTDSDKRAYWPKWMERYFRPVFPIGYVRSSGLFGLIGATLITAEDMEASASKALELLSCAHREFPNVRAVALAGRIPGFVRRAGGDIRAPFIDGSRGTRFTMRSIADALAERVGRPPSEVRVAVLGGAGFIGRPITEDLSVAYRHVVSFDPRYAQETTRENILQTNNPGCIGECDIALVLTASGDDIRAITTSFHGGMLVADDTHPPMHRDVRAALRKRKVVLFKASLRDDRLRMFPRLPNFHGDDIPGCLLETLVVLREGRNILESQAAFNAAAARAGFRTQLREHLDDS